ncbi:MAG: FKBP-type peptidyl-prolyl cis-trans isomerase [Clostridium sp.]|nr:FKBP-type peptidyl-prolyl cis-trans isomerase [Prevotella sp.]MCM1429757.1 FKBP-type peptidyl-prolyl cis-trans isomerase [Clostridium sp.]MCM1474928.1 FKBP-type peptidyl-prolyl cis-trans isomerase [Muribaculaceae bacterium]
MKKTFAIASAAILSMAMLGACKSEKTVADSDTIPATEEITYEVDQVDSTSTAFKYGPEFFNNESLKGNGLDSTYCQTPSGLKYVVVKAGSGVAPTEADKVTVNYEGRLTNGTIFDSSYARQEPATFPLGGVIKGWTEGLQTMKEGGETIFYIPSDLAYGEQGTPDGSIPPSAPLIFRVELISVNK